VVLKIEEVVVVVIRVRRGNSARLPVLVKRHFVKALELQLRYKIGKLCGSDRWCRLSPSFLLPP
jgi:hypothetical protein